VGEASRRKFSYPHTPGHCAQIGATRVTIYSKDPNETWLKYCEKKKMAQGWHSGKIQCDECRDCPEAERVEKGFVPLNVLLVKV
jgi:hypothetical protein